MKKAKLKIIFTLFFVFISLFNSFCFAENSNNGIMLISENLNQQSVEYESQKSDLYAYSKNEFSIKNIIEGNVFASVKDLEIDSTYNGGVINGNLFAMANNVNIKSNAKYSETEKNESGNLKLDSVTNISKIEGNVFITANKFVLDPACEINGDLYICANEIILSQNAVINGNVFAFGNSLTLNSKIENGSLYATVKNFDMQYYGYVFRDIHISAETANLSGIVYRNSFISADKITTTPTFSVKGDFNINSASELEFSGEVKGNAKINSKNIKFNNVDESKKDTICKIYGNLEYSSSKEIQLEENKIVLGSINYSEYKNSSNLFSTLCDYIIDLIASLVYIVALYIVINKFAPNYINKLSSINISKFFLSIGIGLGILILVPVLTLLLFMSHIGALLGILLAILYVLMLLIAKPIFVISVANLIKNKKLNNAKSILLIISISIILSLVELIPFIGFIISLFVTLFGLGIFIKSLKK